MSRRATRPIRRGVIATLVLLAVFLTASAVAAPVREGHYVGQTSETLAVRFDVTVTKVKGKRHLILRNFSTTIGYNGKCGEGGGPVYSVSAKPLSIAGPRGSFSGPVRLKALAAGLKDLTGRLTGTGSGRVITGEVVATFRRAPRCNGYTETFRATAA